MFEKTIAVPLPRELSTRRAQKVPCGFGPVGWAEFYPDSRHANIEFTAKVCRNQKHPKIMLPITSMIFQCRHSWLCTKLFTECCDSTWRVEFHGLPAACPRCEKLLRQLGNLKLKGHPRDMEKQKWPFPSWSMDVHGQIWNWLVDKMYDKNLRDSFSFASCRRAAKMPGLWMYHGIRGTSFYSRSREFICETKRSFTACETWQLPKPSPSNA